MSRAMYPKPERGDTRWMETAACLDKPSVWFALGPGGHAHPQGRKTCRSCPHRRVCLAYALDHDIWVDLWGGHTPAERSKVSRP